MPYPIIMNGDHAEFEADWAASGKPDNERPDWPLPSFEAPDWSAAFCKIATNLGYKDAEGKPIDEGWMITWFANALMRGHDEHAARNPSMEGISQFLFGLLDDIDTCGDIAKADDKAYREMVERIHRKRFEVASTDGYTVTFHPKAAS